MALNTKLRLACILQDMGSYREFWAAKGKVWSTLLVRLLADRRPGLGHGAHRRQGKTYLLTSGHPGECSGGGLG